MEFLVGLSLYGLSMIFFGKIYAKQKISHIKSLRRMINMYREDLENKRKELDNHKIVINYLIDDNFRIKQLCKENNIEYTDLGEIISIQIKRYTEGNKPKTEEIVQN